jgi:hypothetical protein
MYIKELDKDTMLVKVISTDKNDKHIYLVEEHIEKGLRTVIASKDPTKAKLFTLQEAYKITYENLDEENKQDIIKAHEKIDSYGMLSRRLNDQFKIITTDRVDYGYKEDVIHEAKLLEQLDLGYMCKSVQTIIKDVDDND